MLVSGRYFNFEDPDSCEFDIEDIAHALSNICRFTGHCKEFYSVAQHSVLVSYVVHPQFAFQGLLHDAPEGLIGDVSKPLKNLLPDYEEIETRVTKSVHKRLGIPEILHPSVKLADLILLRTEQRDLMNANDHTWHYTKDLEPLSDTIIPLPPKEAKKLFLDRYKELTK